MNTVVRYPKLYAWTTELYQTKNWLKIGDTMFDVDNRIINTDTTGMAEPPIKKLDYDLEKICIRYNLPPTNKVDKWIHSRLEKDYGVNRIRNNREFFEVTVDKLKSILNELEIGVLRPNRYEMRQEQSDAVNSAFNYFNNGGNEFLLNCKCGFGKCFVTYQLIKKFGYDMNVLILTSKPSVEDSWKNDLDNHVDFVDFNYSYIKTDEVVFKNNSTNIVFGSFQDAIGKTQNKEMKSKWVELTKVKFDLLIVDEGHYGANTEKAHEFLKNVNYSRKLILSATPLKMLMSGRYDHENTFTFTYADVQRMKDKYPNEEDYKWHPVMNVFTYNIGDKIKDSLEYYSSEEGLTLNKFFSSDDGEKFNHASAVSKWLDLLATEDERVFASPFNNNISAGKLNHTLWFMESVNSVMAMKRSLNNHPYFSGYRVIAAAGDNDNEGNNTIDLVRTCIKKNAKTITLSCGKLNTGVTIKEWSGVLMLDDTVSAETYWQTVFRVERQNVGVKSDCFVFDFNPNRFLKVTYEYCQYTAKKNQSTSSVIREMLDTMKVFTYSDNKLVKMNNDEFIKIIEHSNTVDSIVSKAASETIVNIVDVNDITDEVYDILNLLKNNAGQNVKVTNIANSSLTKGKNSIVVGGNKSPSKKQKNLLKDIILKITSVTRRFPTFLFIDNTNRYECLNDLFTKSDETTFETVVGISLNNFKILVDNQVLNVKLINKIIEAYTCAYYKV